MLGGVPIVARQQQVAQGPYIVQRECHSATPARVAGRRRVAHQRHPVAVGLVHPAVGPLEGRQRPRRLRVVEPGRVRPGCHAGRNEVPGVSQAAERARRASAAIDVVDPVPTIAQGEEEREVPDRRVAHPAHRVAGEAQPGHEEARDHKPLGVAVDGEAGPATRPRVPPVGNHHESGADRLRVPILRLHVDARRGSRREVDCTHPSADHGARVGGRPQQGLLHRRVVEGQFTRAGGGRGDEVALRDPRRPNRAAAHALAFSRCGMCPYRDSWPTFARRGTPHLVWPSRGKP